MQLFSKVVPYFALLLLFAICLVVLKLFVTNGMYLLQQDPKAMDFIAFYTGASMLFQNHSQMYSLLEQVKIQYQIVPVAQIVNVFLPFFNPPFVALFLAPLALLPILYAYTIWTGINIILLVIMCFLLYRNVHASKTTKIISLIGMFTFIPTLTSLLLGQLSFVVTVFLLLSWMYLKQGKELKGGLLLSFLLIKPHFIILPILGFIVQRRWNVVKGLLFGVTILSIISIIIVGPHGITEYIHLLSNAATWDSGYGIDIKAQHSLQTLLLIMFQTETLAAIRIPWAIVVGILSVATLYFWRKQHSLKSQAFSLQFALLIISILLISPHTHFHDFMLLIVVAIALNTAFIKPQLQPSRYISAMLYLGYFICLVGYILELYFINTSRLGWVVITVSYLLIFWIILVYSFIKTRSK